MKEYLLHLLAYEKWANGLVIDALADADGAPVRAVQLMGHVLSAEQIWYARIAGQTPFMAIWEDVPVVWMAETLTRNNSRLHQLIESRTDDELRAPIRYQNSKGEPFTNTLQQILTHLSHHAAYHRGQVVQLIRPYIAHAPETDYIFWVR